MTVRARPEEEDLVLNDTLVTLEGWLGSPVTLRQAGASSVASFRLATTPRRFNPATNQWNDDQTQWFTINAWRALGENCAISLSSGDPVVVVGKLRTTRWTNAEGAEVTGWEVDAAAVGHDLNRGTSTFVRTQRAAPVPGPDFAAAVDAAEQKGADWMTGGGGQGRAA